MSNKFSFYDKLRLLFYFHKNDRNVWLPAFFIWEMWRDLSFPIFVPNAFFLSTYLLKNEKSYEKNYKIYNSVARQR
jgi:hypothetical protein